MFEFTKCHSLGNDFILLDFYKKSKNELTKLISNTNWKSFVIKSCDKHFGVGADGILIISQNNEILIFNADGSQAELCLNGLRCAAYYLFKKYKLPPFFSCIMGGQKIDCEIDNKSVINQIKIKSSIEEKTIKISDQKLSGHFLQIPNPHFIIQKKITNKNFLKLSPLIESHKNFKNKTNIEFIWHSNENNYEMLVYERGVGPTLACGSGATAVFYLISQLNKIKLNQKIIIKMPGGKLTLWLDKDKKINMQAEANFIFTASFNKDFLEFLF
ncbi:MAG: diaminopimelate epimerase [bacterium]